MLKWDRKLVTWLCTKFAERDLNHGGIKMGKVKLKVFNIKGGKGFDTVQQFTLLRLQGN